MTRTVSPLAAVLLLLACAGDPVPDRAAEPAPTVTTPEPFRLQIVDARGEPVAGASVVIVDPGYALRAGTADAPLVSDAQGVVALDAAADVDEPIALAWAAGHAAARLEMTDSAGTHRLALPDASSLLGRVEGDGRVESVWLQPSSSDAAWPYFVRCDVDAEGRFRADGLAAESYAVTSVPIGSAPVIAADATGRMRLFGVEPGVVPPAPYRFLDREIAADGAEHVLRVAFGVASIVGRITDESGQPIAAAEIRAHDEDGREWRTASDARGLFDLEVEPTPYVHVMASHPDFGDQTTDMRWDGFRFGGPIPDHAITLVLRRGVVLAGVVTDPDGAPFADADLLLVPAYVGSGPRTEQAHTDASGHFAFERMVLGQFDLVPTSLASWSPSAPGRYVRVVGADAEAWVREAGAGRPIAIPLERFELVPVTIEVGASPVQVWTRWGEDLYRGSAPPVSRDRVEITMERGRAHELWVAPFHTGQSLQAPFDRAPDWTGTPDGPLALRLDPS